MIIYIYIYYVIDFVSYIYIYVISNIISHMILNMIWYIYICDNILLYSTYQ